MIESGLHSWGTFWLYGLMCLLATVWMLVYMKETKHLNDKEKKSLYVPKDESDTSVLGPIVKPITKHCKLFNLETLPKDLKSAMCCFCFPIKTGLQIMAFFFVIELLLAVPEFIEFSMPTWYGICLALSLIPGFVTLFYYFRWIFKDNEANCKGLIFAYQLKWL